MFKHILIPTDGSKLAVKGIKAGVKLAKALGAKVTGVYVVLPYVPPVYGEAAAYYAGYSPKEYKDMVEKAARKALAVVEIEAKVAGVPCATRIVADTPPWAGIVKAAHQRKCDAIVIASHGRGGVGGLILGSETQRVLAHSKVPVVVIR
ncbi:MAG TPA: universal stress protein [Burkholderiales bacterium]|jgi:nucleotide-binding universal stress UspA family protein